MLMIIVLVGILLAAFGVSAWMWFQLQQEARQVERNSAVPLADVKTMQPLGEAVGFDHQKEIDQQRLVYEDRLREVKEELEAVQVKAQESERASISLLDALRHENEGLKTNVAELQAAALTISRDAGKLDHMIVENSAFRAQIIQISAEVTRLKESAVSLERENRQLKDASKDVGDTQALIEQAKEEYQRQLEKVYKQVEDLRAENARLQAHAGAALQVDGLKQAADELSGKVRELEMVNAIQAEKNEYLQYELTKSRAQVVGLERACETVLG
jgi:chromosome segregation ATPase